MYQGWKTASKVAGLSSWWLIGVLHRTAYATGPAPDAEWTGGVQTAAAPAAPHAAPAVQADTIAPAPVTTSRA